mgnify:CR=1 FL=1
MQRAIVGKRASYSRSGSDHLPSLQDRLLANGVCFMRDAKTNELEFKRLMFAPVGA